MWFLTGSAYSAFPYETLLILIYDNPIYKAVFCCFTPFYGGLLHPLTDAAHYAMTYLQKPTSRWEHLSHPKLSPVSVSKKMSSVLHHQIEQRSNERKTTPRAEDVTFCQKKTTTTLYLFIEVHMCLPSVCQPKDDVCFEPLQRDCRCIHCHAILNWLSAFIKGVSNLKDLW